MMSYSVCNFNVMTAPYEFEEMPPSKLSAEAISLVKEKYQVEVNIIVKQVIK